MTKTFTITINKEGNGMLQNALSLVLSVKEKLEEATENLKEAVELYLEDNEEATKNISPEASIITSFEVSYA